MYNIHIPKLALFIYLETLTLHFYHLLSFIPQLLRFLCKHASPVLSVSINTVSGMIASLSLSELKLHTINGDIIACTVFSRGMGVSVTGIQSNDGSKSMNRDSKNNENSVNNNINSNNNDYNNSNVNTTVIENPFKTFNGIKEQQSNDLKETKETKEAVARGRVVLAVPCGDWQEGVVAVSGHESGNVYFWRLKTGNCS